MQAEVRTCTFVEPRRRQDASLRPLLRRRAGGRAPAEDRPSGVAHAIGHIDDRADAPATRDGD